MAEQLTPAQALAVENRGGRLLVSAAAGSGKTKVLVDRLMAYLTDPVNPAQLDEFPIITYTRAAAGELRDQLGTAKYRARQLELESIRAGAEKCRGRGDLVLFREALDPELLVALADTTAECAGGAAAVFAGTGDSWRWCVIDKKKDLRPLTKEMFRALSARGGGKPNFQQGSAKAEKGEILAFFREKGFGEADGC